MLRAGGAAYCDRKGDVLFLPAVFGTRGFRPRGAMDLLKIALPDREQQCKDWKQK
jgi:hypothetical protein